MFFQQKKALLDLHEAHESQPGTSRRGRSVPPAKKIISNVSTRVRARVRAAPLRMCHSAL